MSHITMVADAGMVSEANRRTIEAAGLSFILGAKTPTIPWLIADWRTRHPGVEIPDGHVFIQPWPARAGDHRRDQVIYYRYSADSASRTLHGIDEQIGKAERAVAGKISVKRNRFVTRTGADKTVNRTLEAKARALAGIKVYVTNLPNPTPELVIDAYHQLWPIEKSFRMSRHDLRVRPIYHHKSESVDAHMGSTKLAGQVA